MVARLIGDPVPGGLKDWIVEHIPGPIAQALGIASPSKVTAEQGRNVVRGLTLGMGAERRNRGWPRALAGSVGGGGATLTSTVVLRVADPRVHGLRRRARVRRRLGCWRQGTRRTEEFPVKLSELGGRRMEYFDSETTKS